MVTVCLIVYCSVLLLLSFVAGIGLETRKDKEEIDRIRFASLLIIWPILIPLIIAYVILFSTTLIAVEIGRIAMIHAKAFIKKVKGRK